MEIQKANQEKEQARQVALAYKAKVKQLLELCSDKLKGTKYDRFWVESITKRY